MKYADDESRRELDAQLEDKQRQLNEGGLFVVFVNWNVCCCDSHVSIVASSVLTSPML